MDGLSRERQVATRFRQRGYLIASRRHEPGAGDLIALAPVDGSLSIDGDGLEGAHRGLLIEVKATGGGRFERFGPHARAELRELAVYYDLEPVLAYWPAGAELELIFTDDWPNGDFADPSPAELERRRARLPVERLPPPRSERARGGRGYL